MSSSHSDSLVQLAEVALHHSRDRGFDDIFRSPIFSPSLEHEVFISQFEKIAPDYTEQIRLFLKNKNFKKPEIGDPYHFFFPKDHHTFRRVAWFEPIDACKFLALCASFFDQIEAARIPKEHGIIHSHRKALNSDQIFDTQYGFNSFRLRSKEISENFPGGYKVVTDIANFFDRLNLHFLENILKEKGCEEQSVRYLDVILKKWASLASFGIPVGTDASRILAEAALLNVDRRLHESDICFIRYVDDFRIFAKSRSEAHRAVLLLTRILHEEGLFLNAAKTHISKIQKNDEENVVFEGIAGAVEHEPIDEKQTILVTKRVPAASGKTKLAKYYKKPGQEAIAHLSLIEIKSLLASLELNADTVDENIKICVKYFVYIDQNPSILKHILQTRGASIFYIVDALQKERERFSPKCRKQIVAVILDAVSFPHCPYPLHVAVYRLCASEAYMNEKTIGEIFDSFKITDSPLLLREFLLHAFDVLDRMQVRQLVNNYFDHQPALIKRAIFRGVQQTQVVKDAERMALLKSMKSKCGDILLHHI